MSGLQIERLTLARSRDFTLGPIDLEIARGSRTAIVGPSGCGKTSVLRCIAGLEREMAGTIRLGGEVVDDGRRHVPPSARRIGFVFQSGALWPHLDAVAHLRFVDPSLSKSAALERLTEVGLAELADRRPGRMSGGEAQRLALARALVGDPGILLLDEPLSSVDAHLRRELGELLRRVVDERRLTALLVTHDREEALAFADQVVVMREGHVAEVGAADDLLTAPATAFTASFLGRATCWTLRAGDDGTVATPFGAVPDQEPNRSVVLAVLPGDLAIEPNGGDAEARVVRISRTEFGTEIAEVEVERRRLWVPCDRETSVGGLVSLAWRNRRLFPVDGRDAR